MFSGWRHSNYSNSILNFGIIPNFPLSVSNVKMPHFCAIQNFHTRTGHHFWDDSLYANHCSWVRFAKESTIHKLSLDWSNHIYIYILLLVNISTFDSVTHTDDLNKKTKQWNTTHCLHIERLYVHMSFLYLLFPQNPTTIPNIIFPFTDWSKPIITIDCDILGNKHP